MAAEKSATAATRSAGAAENNAAIASNALNFAKQKALEEATRSRTAWLDELVQEAINDWQHKGHLYHIIDREPLLTENETHQFVHRVFKALEKSDEKAERCLADIRERSSKH